MPSNNTGKVVKKLFKENPGRIALLLNPHCIRPHQFNYPYAIDNAAFKKFDEELYFKMLEYSKSYHKPIFCVAPDVVGCHDRTLALWKYYYPLLKPYDYKIAFVAQDGCTPEKIPDDADWIFVGGTDPWKSRNMHLFVGLGKPVHVGRVNWIDRLKKCEEIGVNSVDGTGWMRGNQKQLNDLLEWFAGEYSQLELFD